MNNTTLTKGNATKSLDLTFVRLVQKRKAQEYYAKELQERNTNARVYSTYVRKAQAKAKAKEMVKTIFLLLSTVGMLVWMLGEGLGLWTLIF